jgi:phenylacetate-coenzyme A ligase PaaK-like adenylate-forming protein
MIIGYTSAIFKMAKYIDENKLDIGDKKNLKGVVVTSETVTDYDIKLIKRVFKVPCIIEYGMAETGVIAYSKENSLNIKIFWDSFIGLRDEQNILNITTINDRVFPLINYRTEDLIETNDNNSILQFQKILGRKNDFLKIKIGNNLIESHSEFFTHILKTIKGIISFKIIQKRNLKIEIEYVSRKKLDISNFFFNEIRKEFKNIDQTIFSFKQVENIPQTISGKAKWIELQK